MKLAAILKGKMKSDVKKLLRNFKVSGFKNGDLVITAQVMRIVDRNWGRRNGVLGDMLVVTVWPECAVCGDECIHEHIVQGGKVGGQQNVMARKGGRR